MGDRSRIEWTDASKVCSACRQALPPTSFARDSSRADGRTYVCQACRNRRARASYRKKGPPGLRGWLAPTRDGDGLQARRRVNYLVEKGRIPPPRDLPCADCGDEVFANSYRHEYDHARGYDGANQLYVEPVCSRCHHNREDARRE
jgi:hypothetical protein